MDSKKWVAVWGNAISCDEFCPANYAKDITLRYIIATSMNGGKIRLRFSNSYGLEDVVLTCVTVGRADDDGRVSDFTNVTFNGEKTAGICKGESVYSDDIDFKVKFGEKLAVSIYLKDYTDLHSSISTKGPLGNYMFAKGDMTEKSVLDPAVSEKTGRCYFLDSVEVLTDKNNKAAVVFGDSISAQSWPEWLALRLMDAGRSDISVVRRAVSGSRVLREYTNLSLLKYAHAGIVRFEADITSVKGADRVFVLHGINDIIHPKEGVLFRPMTDLPDAQQIIDGYKKYIEIAHNHGLKIYIATLTPFCGLSAYDDNRNAIRLKVNEWITSNDEADGYIDFAEAVCNPHSKNALLDIYDSGDHLHPSFDGGHALADSVPEEYLK